MYRSSPADPPANPVTATSERRRTTRDRRSRPYRVGPFGGSPTWRQGADTSSSPSSSGPTSWPIRDRSPPAAAATAPSPCGSSSGRPTPSATASTPSTRPSCSFPGASTWPRTRSGWASPPPRSPGLFGPVASLNLIDLVSPPLSALAMFWLLRRWGQLGPAAFVGGLFFGFSPFVVVSLALAHPNFGLLAPVPLIVGCLDDLFVRHRFRPWRVGVVLGAARGHRILRQRRGPVLLVLFAVLAGVVLGGARPVEAGPDRRPLGGRGRCRPSGLAAVVALVLLAYPLWFFFAGPAHLAGRAWPNSPAGHGGQHPGHIRQRVHQRPADRDHAPLRRLPGAHAPAARFPRGAA